MSLAIMAIFSPGLHELRKVAARRSGGAARVTNRVFVHRSVRAPSVCHQHAHQVFLGQFDGLNAGSESKFQLHAASLLRKRLRRVAQRLHNRQLFTGQEADQRAAAGADIAELVRSRRYCFAAVTLSPPPTTV